MFKVLPCIFVLFSFWTSFANVPEIAVGKDFNELGNPEFSSKFNKLTSFNVVGGVAKLRFEKTELHFPISVLHKEGITSYELHRLVKAGDAKQILCESKDSGKDKIYKCKKIAIAF